ncbi:hypothetical protein [Geothrix sp. 21YS21S-4]|uniref:hypothetical protein n=1 Tax=Geothrix sp. 21YS21S-4 TaxID=3068889 RepID=UPI0027BA696E|nr:hypothetical protein [Geothrix sp. 21YS21S-4]
MSEADGAFLASLAEPERIHFRHLALVRPHLPTESQIRMLEGLARSLASPRLLTLMARTPHWLAHWPILLGLAENEATPESIRRDLELVVSLFDQMRELDHAGPAERNERAEGVKALYSQLDPALKPVAKLLAKQLARTVSATGTTQELPPLPSVDADWETLTTPPPPLPSPLAALIPAPREDRLERARSAAQPDELLAFLGDADSDLRRAALQNPLVSEDLVCRALAASGDPALCEEVYAEARWYFREPVRECLQEAPVCPPGLSRRLALSRHLVAALERSPANRAGLRRIASLFTQLEEEEYQFVTYWAKRQAPHLLRVVKYFWDRLQRRPAGLGSTQPERGEDGRWATLEERIFLATQATQEEQLSQVLRDPDPQVFRLALENPALTPRLLATALPALDRERAERLAAHAAWSADPIVAGALIHHPELSEPTLLRLMARLPGLKPLLGILGDARILHLEVKRRAQESLRGLYLALGPAERVAALRAFGGDLLRHIPQEVLQDEEGLQRLVSDRQLDPGLLLRLARNKLTPRTVLGQIAGHPVLMAHAAIMSELLLNPKTPREASIRIWGLLSEAEQHQLLRSPHLPAALRSLI